MYTVVVFSALRCSVNVLALCFFFTSFADLFSGAGDSGGRSVVPRRCSLSSGWTPSAAFVLGHGPSRAVTEPDRRGWSRNLSVFPASAAQHEHTAAGLSGVASGSGRPAQNQ